MADEKRLIDANAAVELLRGLGSRDYRREKGTIADAIKMLSHPAYTPTVDAVEVVRCKDCKHYDYRSRTSRSQSVRRENKTKCCCRSAAIYTKADDFCSYGERREGE